MVTQYFINALIAGSIYAVVALGFAIIYNTIRFFHFAHGALITIGAYSCYCCFVLLNLNLPISILISIVLTSFIGLLFHTIVYKKILEKDHKPLILLIASLGVYVVIQNIISILFGDDVKSIRTEISEGVPLLNARITYNQILIICISLLIMLIVISFINSSKIGKQIKAVSNNINLSIIHGINVEKIHLFVTVVASILAAVVGIMIAFESNISPTMGFYPLMMGVIAVIIGGLKNFKGLIIGAYFIAVIQNISIILVPSEWKDTISFSILLLFLLFRPKGFLSLIHI